MPKCLKCGEVVGAFDIKDGLCQECYTPEAAEELKESGAGLGSGLVELQKGEKVVRVHYKYDLFAPLLGALLPLFDGEFLIFLGVLAVWLGISYFWMNMVIKSHLSVTSIWIGALGLWALFGWLYPKTRIKKLLANGYAPANEESRRRLKEAGLLKEKL